MRKSRLIVSCVMIMVAGPALASFQMKGNYLRVIPEALNLPVPASLEMNGDTSGPELVVVWWHDYQCDVGMVDTRTGATEWIYFADWNEPPTHIYYLDLDNDGLLDALLENGGRTIAVGCSPSLDVAMTTKGESRRSPLAAVPNPSHGTCQVKFTISQPGPVSVTIYDPSGRRVRKVVSGDFPAGQYSPVWDGRDDSGNPVAAGTYLARVSSPSNDESIKVVLVH